MEAIRRELLQVPPHLPTYLHLCPHRSRTRLFLQIRASWSQPCWHLRLGDSFVVGNCPAYCRMFQSIPALYSLDAHSTPPQVVTTENIPWEDKNLEGSLAMSVDTLGCHDGVGYWQIDSGQRDQPCGETSYNARDSTHNKKVSGPECQ